MDENKAPGTDVENSGRRRVLGIFSTSMLGLMAVGTLAGPAMMLVDPALRDRKESGSSHWYNLGSLSNFRVGETARKIVLRRDRCDAWLVEKNMAFGAVLVQRTEERQFRVFSAICPHLGCAVKPTGQRGFICPCHNSTFAPDGSRTPGRAGANNPSPRDLDVLEWRTKDGELQVLWTEYEVGTPDKVVKG